MVQRDLSSFSFLLCFRVTRVSLIQLRVRKGAPPTDVQLFFFFPHLSQLPCPPPVLPNNMHGALIVGIQVRLRPLILRAPHPSPPLEGHLMGGLPIPIRVAFLFASPVCLPPRSLFIAVSPHLFHQFTRSTCGFLPWEFAQWKRISDPFSILF